VPCLQVALPELATDTALSLSENIITDCLPSVDWFATIASIRIAAARSSNADMVILFIAMARLIF